MGAEERSTTWGPLPLQWRKLCSITSASALLKERKPKPMHKNCHRGVRVGVVVVASDMLASREDMGCVVVVVGFVYALPVCVVRFCFQSAPAVGLVLFFFLARSFLTSTMPVVKKT